MISIDPTSTIGVLLSGGLDSSILLAWLAERAADVQPFYIRSQLVWEHDEQTTIERFIAALRWDSIRPLITLDMPLGDLYRDHWSITGRDAPDASTADEAVYLPGRNALLVIKAAIWCQLQGIRQLALAPLGTSPFADAKPEFFDHLQAALNCSAASPIQVLRPFATMSKRQVMQLGRNYPLELTFSCIAPRDGQHCGQCNKCAERRNAFQRDGRIDPTRYATGNGSGSAAAPR